MNSINKKSFFKNFPLYSSTLIFLTLSANQSIASPIQQLHNDEGNTVLEALHIDATIPHYEFEEELERGVIEREIEHEINELLDIEEDIVEQELDTPNFNGVDISHRTNFFSNDDYDDPTYQIDVLNDSVSDFYFFHQLPPAVNPDVNTGIARFNDFDFTSDLIEFEFELEGWTTDNPADSTYEVRIMDNEVFGYDNNNMLTLTTPGIDVGVLGELSFDSLDDGRYEFEFEFEQYDDMIAGNDIFISQEIYEAIEDGIFGVHIARTSGSGNLFLEESALELEKPSASVSAPGALALFGLGLLGLVAVRRKQ